MMKLKSFEGEIQIQGTFVPVVYKDGSLTLSGLSPVQADLFLRAVVEGTSPGPKDVVELAAKTFNEPAKVYQGEPVKPKVTRAPRTPKETATADPRQTEIPGTETAPKESGEAKVVEPAADPPPPEPEPKPAAETATKKQTDVMVTAPPSDTTGVPEGLRKALRFRDVIEYFVSNGCTTAEEVLEKCLAYKDALPALQRIESLDIERVGRAFNMFFASTKVA